MQQKKLIIIDKDQGYQVVAKKLLDNQIIHSNILFRVLHLIQDRIWNKKIKVGEYEFLPQESLVKVLKKIYSGKSFKRKITIPEGYTVNKIIKTLYEIPHLKGIINTPVPEGSLFPSTYFYSYGISRQELINQMTREMDVLLNEMVQNLNPKKSPIKTKQDLLIFASIIEKESRFESDKTKIASVLLNRLRTKMRLQVDATVVYHITDGYYDNFNRKVSYEDIKINSPYNTYKFYGLPIGPICCPGKASIEAATTDEVSDFFYFIAKDGGKIIYNKTLKDHNIEKFKK